jgi:ATP-dependent Clp endopeptidase proteolytic subunit ClpP
MNWFRMSVKPGRAEVWIEGAIGWEQTVDDFRTEFAKVSQMPEIRVRINSPGGSISDGMVIYNLIAELGDKVTTENMGLAASMASVIFMAGSKRIMRAGSRLMIHNPWTIAMGSSEELRHEADILESYRDSLVSIYAGRSGYDRDALIAMMDEETWITPEDALEMGLATETDGENVARAASASRAEFSEIVNKYNGLQAPTQEAPMKEPIKAEEPVVAPVEEIAEPTNEAVAAEPSIDREALLLEGVRMERERSAAVRTRAGAAGLAGEQVEQLVNSGASVAEADTRIVDMLINGQLSVGQKIEVANYDEAVTPLPSGENPRSLVDQYNSLKGAERVAFYNKNKMELRKAVSSR